MKPTDVVYIDTPVYLKHREKLDRWVTDHGLEPRNVPLPSTFWFFADHFEVVVFERDKDGRLFLAGDTPASRRVSVPLLRPWPLLAKTKP